MAGRSAQRLIEEMPPVTKTREASPAQLSDLSSSASLSESCGDSRPQP